MKKMFFRSLAVAAIAAVASYNVYQSNSVMNRLSDLALANVEALADDENNESQIWEQPETVACKLELGGGWFTASVQRDCVFCAVPNSCTPIVCGGDF